MGFESIKALICNELLTFHFVAISLKRKGVRDGNISTLEAEEAG